MSAETDLGKLDATRRGWRRLDGVRVLLPAGWALAAVGFFGPWIAHPSAGLTLSGVDMGEFVKFLPGALDGTLPLVRQLFYLPPVAISASIALLVGSPRLGYRWQLQMLALISAVPLSLQLLPPAWSPSSLLTAEFRLQTLSLGLCWLLLAAFKLLGKLPSWLNGSLSTALSLLGMGLPLWQYLAIKPSINSTYGMPPASGWGISVCLAGLAITAGASAFFALIAGTRSRSPWSSE